MIEQIKITLKNINQRKLRSALTVLGIVIAVITVFVLISLSLGLQSAVEEQFKTLGIDKIFIQPRGQLAGPGTGGAVQLTQDDIDAIERVRGVKDLSWSVAAPTEIKFGDEKRFFNVVGFPLEKADVFSEAGAYKADEGRLLKEGDREKVMIGSHYKYNRLFEKPLKQNDKMIINGLEFKVEGILEPIGNPGDDRIIYMNIEDLKLISNVGERIDFIVVQIVQGENINGVSARIEKTLFKSRNVDEDNKDFTILTPEELLESFGNILKILTGFLLGVAAISLIVGGINIANTMFTSVLERTKDVGVMKAVGAKNKDIFKIFVFESGFLGIAGGIVGVGVGWIISEIIEYIAKYKLGTTLLQTQTPIVLFIGCLAFAFVVGMVFGALPAIRAGKLNVVDSLRYE